MCTYHFIVAKDICISAVKEKEIESKLKQVREDWKNQDFQFGTFKNRGELLLKGEKIQEIVGLMEDSLMVLGSLMTNRYNVIESVISLRSDIAYKVIIV